jgi:Protein of unknown function (DUF3168)
VRPFGSMTSGGAVHEFDVTVHTGRDGFEGAKKVAGQVCEALVGAAVPLADGALVDLRFVRAKAERGKSPVKRKISLRFRAVVDSD